MKTLSNWKNRVMLKKHEELISELLKHYPRVKIDDDFEPTKFDEELTMVGIEVEMENNQETNDEMAYWGKDRDPSLRNNGVELRSVILPTQKYVAGALTELASFLKHQPKHDFSWRTSTHVHLDITKMNLVDFCNFLLIYISLEPLLFKVFAEERRNSVYCVPLFESALLTNKKESALIANLFKSAVDLKDFDWGKALGVEWPRDEKYSAINFFRLSDLGTVEFRHLAGTDKIERIRDWISILVCLVRASKGFIGVEGLSETIKALNTKSRYFDYLEFIFGEVTKLVIIPDYEQYIAKGVRKCKEILALNSKPAHALLKISSKGAISKHLKEIKEKQQSRLKRTYD